MESEPLYADVAVFAALPNPLTYRIPEAMMESARRGQRVLVPLGKRTVRGLLLAIGVPPPEGVRTRRILQRLDEEAVLSDDLLDFGKWIAGYYFAAPGGVFQAMLPLQAETRERRTFRITPKGRERLKILRSRLLSHQAGELEGETLQAMDEAEAGSLEADKLRRKIPRLTLPFLMKWVRQGMLSIERESVWRGKREKSWIRPEGEDTPLPSHLSPAEKRILETLRANSQAGSEAMPQANLLKQARARTTHLRRLEQRGFLSVSTKGPSPETSLNKVERPYLPIEQLTSAQEKALAGIRARLEEDRFQVMLLHGVTGSGKTEVYLRAVAEVLKRGRGALMLVPEIALTPELQRLLTARFSGKVAILHSALRARERAAEWWRVRRGEARLVVGTRSAVMAPIPDADLGLVVVDEEHDAGYKQQEEPRYHGRDLAIVRAQRAGVVALLGSATPSLESYWNAQQGRYQLLELDERVQGRPLAEVEILDMREQFRKTHSAEPVSKPLREELCAQLESNAQVMILINRRGYSWFVMCRSCGRSEQCENCSVALTYHRRDRRLVCHYCGFRSPLLKLCRSCGSEYLQYVGTGTEKLTDLLAVMFPAARIGRLDRDVAHRAGEYRRVLDRFRRGELNLLVGTQMIAKGHDFPGVTLVGVIASDAALALPDFRAAERIFQLLTQSAGRAGRGSEPGRVLIQTSYPEHYAIRAAARQDYRAFYEKEIHFRRMMHYPPLTALANLVVRHESREKAAALAKKLGRFLEPLCRSPAGLKLLGPGPAPLERLHRYYRWHLILKARSRPLLNGVLTKLQEFLSLERIPRSSVVVDVDPVNLM